VAERVFNRMRRPVYRKHLSWGEAAGGLVVVAALAAAVAWVALQRNRYDPADRDVAYAVLQADSVEDRLYRRPLQTWVEPGQGGPPATAEPALGVFSPQILAEGWRVGSRMREFDPDTLYEKINGAAEQFLRFGFRRLHFVGLRAARGSAALDIELYDQGDFTGGLGIFSAQRDPGRPVAREGALHYYETPVGAVGVKGPWFFRIAGNEESPAVREKSRQLVSVLAELPVPDGGVPFGFRVLGEGMGLPLEDIAHLPENAFQFDFAKDFWFGRMMPGEPARYFVHRAAGADVAAELYERLLSEQRYDYDPVAEGEETTLLRHRFLKNFFAMALDGPLIFGVENVQTREAADAALGRIAGVVRPRAGA
jgi:hypothetical protein